MCDFCKKKPQKPSVNKKTNIHRHGPTKPDVKQMMLNVTKNDIKYMYIKFLRITNINVLRIVLKNLKNS